MRLRLFTAFTVFAALSLQAQQFPSNQQQKLLDLTNNARMQQGLQPLHWDPLLASAAQAHAQKMADQQNVSHQLAGEPDLQARAAQAGAHFREVAENVAMGPSLDDVQKQWMHSPPHRANILDAKLTNIGIGVAQRSGYWYAAVVFDSAVDNLAVNQVEQKVADLLRQHGIDPSRPPDAARKDCATDEGDASGTHALFIMRWEGSNLDQLPPQLEQRLGSGRYKTASVGSCSSGQSGNQGFTTYKVAVLLY